MDQSGLMFMTCLSFGIQESLAASERYYMEDKCGHLVDMEATSLESVRLELTKFQLYHDSLDCVFRLKAPENKRLEVKILENNIEVSENCTKDFLQIYDGQELISDILTGLDRRVCSTSVLQTSYASTSDYITIRFRSDQSEALDGFRLLISAFRSDPDHQCYSTEFQCHSNDRCISEQLVCDRFGDCTDNSDQCGLSVPAIIAISVGGVVAFLAIIAIFLCVCCLRNKQTRSGSTKRLNQRDISDDAATPVDEHEISDMHYYRPMSYHQPMYAVPSNHSAYTVNGPYYTSNKPEPINTRKVWITAPSDATYISAYN